MMLIFIRIASSIAIAIGLVLPILEPVPSYANWGTDIIKEIGLLNPAARVIEPIEEAIPKLTISGSIRNMDFLLANGKGQSGITGLNKRRIRSDWGIIDWLGELKLSYDITPWMVLNNINNFRYDAVYDWAKPDEGLAPIERHWFHQIQGEKEYYRDTKEILRELYLDIFYGQWLFKVGKQQIAIGKQDFKVIDIINPEYDKYGQLGDTLFFENDRIPTWMFQTLYFWSDYSLRFAWIPDHEPGVPVFPGEIYSPRSLGPNIFPYKVDKPSWDFENHEWFFEFTFIKSGWDTSIGYFYDWSDLPFYFVRAKVLDRGRVIPLKIEPEHTRLHRLMAGVSKTFRFFGRNWDLRLENLFTLNSYQSTKGERNILNADNLTKVNINNFTGFLNTYWFRGRFFTSLIFLDSRIFKYDKRDMMPAEKGRFFLAFSASQNFARTEDKLGWYTTFYWWTDQGDVKMKIGIKYKFGDYLSAQADYYWFAGNPDDIIGSYKDLDSFRFYIKYEF